MGWAGQTHEFLVAEAVNHIPSEIASYITDIEALKDYSRLPDVIKISDPGESPNHYYNYDTGKGNLPYALRTWTLKLEDAFRLQTSNIIYIAGYLSHYATDANMPLHCTSNYNPNGKHSPYETTVNYYVSEADYEGIFPRYINQDISDYSYGLIEENYYISIDLAKELSKGASWSPEIKEITYPQLRKSVQFIVDLWYTAYINANDLTPTGEFVSYENVYTILQDPSVNYSPISGNSSIILILGLIIIIGLIIALTAYQSRTKRRIKRHPEDVDGMADYLFD